MKTTSKLLLGTFLCWSLGIWAAFSSPVLSGCPQPFMEVQCYSQVPPPPEVTAWSNCDGDMGEIAPMVWESNPESSCNNMITRIWFVVDTCGGISACAQQILVKDLTAPSFSIEPALLALDQAAAVPEPFDGVTLTASDDCGGAVTIEHAGDATSGDDCSYTITRTYRAIDACGNFTDAVQIITVENCAEVQVFCSLGQGFYGNAGGVFQGFSSGAIVAGLLAGEPLTIGLPGRSLTITGHDVASVELRLPGGGPSAVLPVGDAGFNSAGEIVGSATAYPLHRNNHRFRNSLLAETITLALNLRLDERLGSVAVQEVFCTVAAIPDGEGALVMGDDSTLETHAISVEVIEALGDLGLAATVAGLFELANRGLGGHPTAGASLSRISQAVSTYNEAFSECRFLAECPE
jgi:hypothetical protein